MYYSLKVIVVIPTILSRIRDTVPGCVDLNSYIPCGSYLARQSIDY